MALRLRQIALATADIDTRETEFRTLFEAERCFVDERLAYFKARNAMFPIGDQFVELVAPTEPDSASARFLDRRGGDGGYMLVLQAMTSRPHHSYMDDTNIRLAHSFSTRNYDGFQIHPVNSGGIFFELGHQRDDPAYDHARFSAAPADTAAPHDRSSMPAEAPSFDRNGPWMPAGRDSTSARRDPYLAGITAVHLVVDDPQRSAAFFADLANRAATPADEGYQIQLLDAALHLHPWRGGAKGIVGMELGLVSDTRLGPDTIDALTERAGTLGLSSPSDDDASLATAIPAHFSYCGVRISLRLI